MPKILAKSVFDSFLAVLLLAFLVISAALTVALVAPMAGVFLKGAGLSHLVRLALIGFHEMLQLSVPITVFVACLIVFSRLNADGELNAMRACGLRLRGVACGPIVFAALVSGLFIWMNGWLIPREHELRRRLKGELIVASGFKLVNPGDTVDAGEGLRLRFDSRDGETLRGLTVQDRSDPRVSRLLAADRARLAAENGWSRFELEGMSLEPLDAARTYRLRARRFNYRMPEDLTKFRYDRRDKDLTMGELLAHLRHKLSQLEALAFALASEGARSAAETDFLRRGYGDIRRDAVSIRLEFGRRIVYALAPFCFVLIGIALGARARRGEIFSVAAWAIATLLAYYLFTFLMLSASKLPSLHPEILIYLPPLVSLAIGLGLLRKL